MNMGYVRFENTLRDLRDCEEHMDDEELSESEQAARHGLIGVCENIVSEWGEPDSEPIAGPLSGLSVEDLAHLESLVQMDLDAVAGADEPERERLGERFSALIENERSVRGIAS